MIRIRPDGTGLEVVSTGERNPLSVALSATDEVFTYGNDDDSKQWPNSLTHHIVGGHYGYPYQFLTAPHRALPIMAGQAGGAGAQGICYNEDGLPAGVSRQPVLLRLGLQTVFRFEIRKAGGTFATRAAIGSGHQGGRCRTSARSRWPSPADGRASGWSTGPTTAGWPTARAPGGSIVFVIAARARSFRYLVPPDGMPPYDWRPSTIRRCRSDWSRSGCWRNWARPRSRTSSSG